MFQQQSVLSPYHGQSNWDAEQGLRMCDTSIKLQNPHAESSNADERGMELLEQDVGLWAAVLVTGAASVTATMAPWNLPLKRVF